MERIIHLLLETSESAFLFGTFLYGLCFIGDSVVSKFFGSHTGAGYEGNRAA